MASYTRPDWKVNPQLFGVQDKVCRTTLQPVSHPARTHINNSCRKNLQENNLILMMQVPLGKAQSYHYRGNFCALVQISSNASFHTTYTLLHAAWLGTWSRNSIVEISIPEKAHLICQHLQCYGRGVGKSTQPTAWFWLCLCISVSYSLGDLWRSITLLLCPTQYATCKLWKAVYDYLPHYRDRMRT